MAGVYARDTEVSAERSKAEIERILTRYGAEKFMYSWDSGKATIAFVAKGRTIKITLTLPDRMSPEFAETPMKHLSRTPTGRQAAYEQAVRQRWRALALVLKAKLEAVSAGIASFEDEFLAYTMLPDGQTVAAWIQPQLKEVASGRMPLMLTGG